MLQTIDSQKKKKKKKKKKIWSDGKTHQVADKDSPNKTLISDSLDRASK